MPASTLEPTPLPPTAPRCPACGNSMRLEGSAPSTHYVNRDQFKYVCDCGDTAEKTVAWQPPRQPHAAILKQARGFVAYWGEGCKGKRRSLTIKADEFFGRAAYGAPMTADQLYMMINKLRRM
jgi:hypothetical protein